MSYFIHEDKEDTNLLRLKCSALLSELKHPFEGNIVNLRDQREFKVPNYMVINLGKLLNYMIHRMYLETITGRKFQDTFMQDSDDYVYVNRKAYSSPDEHFVKDERNGMAKWSLQELVSSKYWAELSNYARDKEIHGSFCHHGLINCDMCFNEDFAKILVKMFNMDIDEDQEQLFRDELYKNIAHHPCSSGVGSTL